LNPNIVGYSFISWFVILIHSIQKEVNLRKKQIKIAFFLLFYLIYTLSCWYGAFFFALILWIYFLLSIIFNFVNTTQIIKEFFLNLNIKIWIFFLPLYLYFVWLFSWVYISVSGDPDRPFSDLSRNSPNIKMLYNGNGPVGGDMDGSIFKGIYQNLNLNFNAEYNIGIGIFISLFGLLAILITFLNKSKTKLKIVSATFLIAYLFFIELFNDFSFFRVFFENIPGFNSIRFPGRFIIFLGYFLIFLVFYQLDKYFNISTNLLFKFLFVLIGILILVDQYRAPYSGWDKKLLKNEYLFSMSDEIKRNCDYFYYDYPGGWWYDQIEAITYSVQVGVPTVNGYSGAFPPNYPVENFNSELLPNEIFEWIEKIDKSKNGCFINGVSGIYNFNSKNKSVDLVGFSPAEKKKTEYWQWAVSPNPYFYLINFDKDFMNLSFEIGKKVKLKLDFRDSIVKILDVQTNTPSCKVSNDDRPLFFEIKNLKIN
jgi:hypothetical protein